MNKSPKIIHSLNQDEVFVFGSNKHGHHDGGAALFAHSYFGAFYGKGHGLHGKSYAIDTMSGLDNLKDEIEIFISFAKSRPDLKFLVTEIGCVIGGYKPEQISVFFIPAREVENIYLPESFF